MQRRELLGRVVGCRTRRLPTSDRRTANDATVTSRSDPGKRVPTRDSVATRPNDYVSGDAIVSVKEVFDSGALKAYAWNWRTRLTAKRNVTIISSVWGENGNCGRSLGYCGLGLRLIRDVFQSAHVEPQDAKSGDKLTRSEERRVGKECRSRWSPY